MFTHYINWLLSNQPKIIFKRDISSKNYMIYLPKLGPRGKIKLFSVELTKMKYFKRDMLTEKEYIVLSTFIGYFSLYIK